MVMGLVVNRIIFVLAIFGIVAGCDRLLIHEAKDEVAAQLKDPESAKFRNIRSDGDYVCGEVNGANSFGAMAGYSPFYAFKSVEGEWIVQIYDESQIEQLPTELVEITRRNYQMAIARCDDDSDAQDRIQREEMREMCDEGSEAACDLVEDLKAPSS